MARGNLSFIHRAMKDKDPDEFDLNEKERLIKILREFFGVHGITDRVLFFKKDTGVCQEDQPNGTKSYIFKNYHVHLPDIVITGFVDRKVIEIDGPVHWQNSKAVKATNERNEHYELGGVQLIWFTRDEVKKADLKAIVEKLKLALKMEPRKRPA